MPQSPDILVSGSPDLLISRSPDPRISFSYVIPVLLALFTSFLMIRTAAVVSSPQDFITGGGGFNAPTATKTNTEVKTSATPVDAIVRLLSAGGVTTFATSSTFNSAAMDFGAAPGLKTLNYNAMVPAAAMNWFKKIWSRVQRKLI